MNFKIVTFTIGQILKTLAAFMVIPLVVSLAFGETSANQIFSFVVPIMLCLVLGFILANRRPEDTTYYAREGLLIVGFSWIIISLIGALPFTIATYGDPDFADMTYIDWLFESVSGFTTTGATVLHDAPTGIGNQIDIMNGSVISGRHYCGLLLWRALTHWMGGMGMLIFILAILPTSSDGASSIHIMQAESTGQSVGKLVSRVGRSARILYLIYTVMTALLFCMLLIDMAIPTGDGIQQMDAFNAAIFALSTAGTGGFAAVSTSAAGFSLYVQIMLIVFMFLFGVNFNIYFLVLVRKFKDAFRSEELRFYCITVLVAIFAITLNLCISGLNAGSSAVHAYEYKSFGTALKDSTFTVVSCMTSTGFATTDFDTWPVFARVTLLLLMFIGACAGSTGGGFKCSRFLVLIKSMWVSCKRVINPHAVYIVKLNGKKVNDEVTQGVFGYFVLHLTILIAVTVILSFDPFAAADDTVLTSLSSSMACLNNIGPGLTPTVGPMANFFGYTVGMKCVLSVEMLIGRLEIFPILMLFNPKTYSRQ